VKNTTNTQARSSKKRSSTQSTSSAKRVAPSRGPRSPKKVSTCEPRSDEPEEADDSLAPSPYQVRRFRLRQLLSEFLRAVDTLATAPESSLRGRLAYAAVNVLVLHPASFPEDLRPRFDELVQILQSGHVPAYLHDHPRFARNQPANYLSHSKARRATTLLIGLLESIAYELSFDIPPHHE
jgi:hypothetical protein